eukprot:1161182-Pelagomonas_calceolata.AAC.19
MQSCHRSGKACPRRGQPLMSLFILDGFSCCFLWSSNSVVPAVYLWSSNAMVYAVPLWSSNVVASCSNDVLSLCEAQILCCPSVELKCRCVSQAMALSVYCEHHSACFGNIWRVLCPLIPFQSPSITDGYRWIQKQRRPPVKTTDCWPAHKKRDVQALGYNIRGTHNVSILGWESEPVMISGFLYCSGLEDDEQRIFSNNQGVGT